MNKSYNLFIISQTDTKDKLKKKTVTLKMLSLGWVSVSSLHSKTCSKAKSLIILITNIKLQPPDQEHDKNNVNTVVV